MKKIFAIAAMAAMLIACGDEKPENKPGNGGGTTPEPEVPEYVDAITIDGDFADWEALDASKVLVATCAENPYYGALKTVKVYADELYINIYFEAEYLADGDDANDFHIDVCINCDGDEATGGYAANWTDAGIDYLLEGCVRTAGAYVDYDADCFAWGGEVGAEGWTWNSDLGLAAGNGLTVGKGTFEGGYEIKITKDLIPMDFADEYTLGVGLSMSWNRYGLLPNADVTEEDAKGLAAQFVVK